MPIHNKNNTENIMNFDGKYICIIASCHFSEKDKDKEPFSYMFYKSDNYKYCNIIPIIKKLGGNRHVTPGTIEILNSSVSNSTGIILMFSKLYPGKSCYANDSLQKRENWFKICLDKILSSKINSIAFDFMNLVNSDNNDNDNNIYLQHFTDFSHTF